LLLLCAAFIANAQITAIRAGKVVHPESGTVLNNQIILVEGQNIKAIGADVKIPAGATVIDFVQIYRIAGIV
jgi:imidazolonepropionase-like amidohydrolase